MKTRTPLRFFPRILPCTETAPRCDGGATLKPAGTEVVVDLILPSGRLLVRSLETAGWCFCDRAELDPRPEAGQTSNLTGGHEERQAGPETGAC